MIPHLRSADFDGSLAAALAKVSAAATPEHAAALERGRQINAVLGLVGAPIVFLGLSGWAFFHWRRFGKDPVYLDDASILMPAPPPDLTAASGAMVMDGSTSRRALTTAMLDLASRGLIAFREESSGLLGLGGKKVGVDVSPAVGEAEVEAHRRLNARRPTGPAEDVAYRKLRSIGVTEGGFISPEDLPKFGSDVAAFDTALEKHVVDRGWFGEKPSKVVSRWTGRGVLAIIAGVIGIVAGLNIPIAGLTLIGAAAIAGGIVILHLRPGHAGRVDVGRDDPGDAGRLPADAPEDDGPGTLDAAGRRRGGPRLARYAGSGRRLGHGARAAERHRGSPVAQPGRRQGGHDRGHGPLLPGLVPDLERPAVPRLVGRDGERRQRLLRFGHPGHRRDDVGARARSGTPRRRRAAAAAVAGSAAAARAVAAGVPAAGSRRRASDPEHLAAGVEALDGDRPARHAIASARRSSGNAGSRGRRPRARGCPSPFGS